MKVLLGIAALVLFCSLASPPAHAVVCAAGVYRAGCVGPHGGAVVRRPYYGGYGHRACAAGPYRAGCVGPNGAFVHRRW